MTTTTKPTLAELERGIHARKMDRIREVCARTFYGKPEEQQAARNAALAEVEQQAVRELRFLNMDR